MSDAKRFIELFQSGGREIDLHIDEITVKLFKKYMDLLLDWNKKINLTAITDVEEIVIKHFLDSLVIYSKLEVKQHSKIIDVGTGAGFPGIPLKIYRPDLDVVLLDSLMKRVKFLEEVVGQLQLKACTVKHGRAEEMGRKTEFREQFDLAVSRAVAKMPVLVEYNLPFVKVGGRFVAYKSSEGTEEAKKAARAAEELGAELEKILSIRLPFSGDQRTLVVFKKICSTPEKYPRKPGMPEKKPLGILG